MSNNTGKTTLKPAQFKQAGEIEAMLENCFGHIAETRMADIPICNKALSVKAMASRRFGAGWLSVLLTPWFMNLAYLEDETDKEGAEAPAPIKVGAKRSISLPAGRFEFICSYEEAIGVYWMCSLFSPVFEFAEQEIAVATGMAAMEEVFSNEHEAEEGEAEMAMMWRGEIPVIEDEDEDEAQSDAAARYDKTKRTKKNPGKKSASAKKVKAKKTATSKNGKDNKNRDKEKALSRRGFLTAGRRTKPDDKKAMHQESEG